MRLMQLREYLDTRGRGCAAALARTLGVNPVMVSQWAAGLKLPGPERCPAIEAFTGSMVPRWELRPDDWHLIWPELIGAPGAPAVDGDVRRHGADGTPATGARIEEAQRAA